jgi:hypothetical protein
MLLKRDAPPADNIRMPLGLILPTSAAQHGIIITFTFSFFVAVEVEKFILRLLDKKNG